MARLPRTIIAGLPHHVTQRGNGRAQTFFEDGDYRHYLALLGGKCREQGVAVWAWVLMPNHVHLILTPKTREGMIRALAETHRAYAGFVHARLRRTGHFWQGRFGCVVMDEHHLGGALRYVAFNPVRARLAARPTDWPWSSVHAQLDSASGDRITDTEAVGALFPDFAALIALGEDEEVSSDLRKAETVGRPLGTDTFLEDLERQTARVLRPAKRGPKPQAMP